MTDSNKYVFSRGLQHHAVPATAPYSAPDYRLNSTPAVHPQKKPLTDNPEYQQNFVIAAKRALNLNGGNVTHPDFLAIHLRNVANKSAEDQRLAGELLEQEFRCQERFGRTFAQIIEEYQEDPEGWKMLAEG